MQREQMAVLNHLADLIETSSSTVPEVNE